MRAFTVRGSSYMRQGLVVTLSNSRMWCSGEKDGQASERVHSEEAKKKVAPEDIAKLEAELTEAKATMSDLKKEVLYRAADAENARRISRDDVEKAKLYGVTSFGKDMLEVADTLEKGIEAFRLISAKQLEEDKYLNSIYTGVKLSIKVLYKNLSKHGIERMNVTVGTKFDPNFHDALVRTPATSEAPPETISHVLKDGYKIKNRVLRAAQVGVALDGENQ